LSAVFGSMGNVNFQNATFTESLVSTGQSSFYDMSIADQFSVGAQLTIGSTSINVLGANLALQPLKQGGVSFEGDEVAIDTDGNLRVNGNANFAKDVNVKGNLFANIISPIPGNDLTIELGSKNQESSHDSQFIIHDSSHSAVLSINDKGDINASGAATFGKLNLNIVSPAFALSDTEVIATGSAGMTSVKTGQKEVTIDNPNVTENSLIYITPKAASQNGALYLMRQVPGHSFTVGINKATTVDIPFNWIIIN
jgi:hypothetical protein